MIRSNQIAYGSSRSALTSFEFGDEALNTVLIATFTTVISYQAAAIIFDVFLGTKSRNEARAKDLHIVLLLRAGSVFSVLESIVRTDRLTKIRFGKYFVMDSIFRSEKTIKIATLAKLFFLLAAVPLVNITSIVFPFAREASITFDDAGFGGLAFGFGNSSSNVRLVPLTKDCREAPVRVEPGDRSVVSFNLCSFYKRTFHSDTNGFAILQVKIWKGGMIDILAAVNGEVLSQLHLGQVRFNFDRTQSYHVHGRIDMEILRKVHREGTNILSKACNPQDGNRIADVLEQVNATSASLAWKVPCPNTTVNANFILEQILLATSSQVTFLDSAEFDVILSEDALSLKEETTSAGKFQFLTRTRRYASMFELAIASVVLVFIRTVTGALFNNDTDEGIHLLIKKRFGLWSWESLLRWDEQTGRFTGVDFQVD